MNSYAERPMECLRFSTQQQATTGSSYDRKPLARLVLENSYNHTKAISSLPPSKLKTEFLQRLEKTRKRTKLIDPLGMPPSKKAKGSKGSSAKKSAGSSSVVAGEKKKRAPRKQKNWDVPWIRESKLPVEKLLEWYAEAPKPKDTADFVPDPAGLKTKLLPHQKYGLTWMSWLESQSWVSGGILADEMGLGKTLSMLSLIVKSKVDGPRSNDEPTGPSADEEVPRNNATLIICPASVIDQWIAQIKEHCEAGALRFKRYHGTNRKVSSPDYFSHFDVVVTSYGVMVEEFEPKKTYDDRVLANNYFHELITKENGPSPLAPDDFASVSTFAAKKPPAAVQRGMLFRVKWRRVILDEAHGMRNEETKTAKAACQLYSLYRWCLTGTPIHNNTKDLFSLVKFLGFKPFDEESEWIHLWGGSDPKKKMTFIRLILLRRTKDYLKKIGNLNGLPSKSVRIVQVKLSESDRLRYNEQCQILKLRLNQEVLCRVEYEKNEDGVESEPAGSSAPHEQQQPISTRESSETPTNDADFDDSYEEFEDVEGGGRRKGNSVLSIFLKLRMICAESKLDRLTKLLRSIWKYNPEEKVIIVSQWTTFLGKIEKHVLTAEARGEAPLVAGKHQMLTLTGDVPVKERNKIVDKFNDPNSGVLVLLLSLRAGGVGLNLRGARTMIIHDPHYNPQHEEQACDRIHRVGQTRNCVIYKLICSKTLEEIMVRLQKQKFNDAKMVLDWTNEEDIPENSKVFTKAMAKLSNTSPSPASVEKAQFTTEMMKYMFKTNK